MIVRGSSFASRKVVATGNVCIWVGTEGVLGKLHDLLIKHGKESWERECTGKKEPSPSELLGKAGRQADPGPAPHALENIPNGTLLGLPGSGDTSQRWPVTSPLSQPLTRTLKCFSDTPQLLPALMHCQSGTICTSEPPALQHSPTQHGPCTDSREDLRLHHIPTERGQGEAGKSVWN